MSECDNLKFFQADNDKELLYVCTIKTLSADTISTNETLCVDKQSLNRLNFEFVELCLLQLDQVAVYTVIITVYTLTPVVV